MKKRNVLALAGITLLAAGVLAACSGSKNGSKSASSDKIPLLIMFIRQILKLWTILCLEKPRHMKSHQTLLMVC